MEVAVVYDLKIVVDIKHDSIGIVYGYVIDNRISIEHVEPSVLTIAEQPIVNVTFVNGDVVIMENIVVCESKKVER